jgi:hypothetical protein
MEGYRTGSAKVEGLCPLLMNDGLTVDKLNPWTIKAADITSKPTKQITAKDEANLALYKWNGALYFDSEMGPVIPDYVLEAVIRDGAKMNSNGKKVEAGLQVEEPVPLIYDGPRTRKALYKDKRFVDRRVVVVNRGNKIIGTRPRFNVWACEFDVHILEDVISTQEVMVALEKAGKYKGMCDYRPKFGRFAVTRFDWTD